MEPPVLTDPGIYPSHEVLATHLGRTCALFDALFDYNHAAHPEFVERWKYYRDGSSWLLNVSWKKKTLFWVSVGKRSFRTGFFFSAKYEEEISRSKIPAELKRQYRGTKGKTFRAISLQWQAKRDLEVYKELLAIKLRVS